VVTIHADTPKHRQENYKNLLASVHHYGLDILDYTIDNGWSSLERLRVTYRIATANPTRPLVFVDSFDTRFVGGLDKLDHLLDKHPMWLSAQTTLWPDETEYQERYKNSPCASPWKYANGSGPTGFGAAIREAMDAVSVGTKDSAAVEQSYWHKIHLNGFARLDSECLVHQTLYLCGEALEVVGEKLKNKVTGTFPQVIHACGQSSFPVGIK
jgi:hypothetical protein